MAKIKNIKNKWQFFLDLDKSYYRLNGYLFIFGIFNIQSFPDPGNMFNNHIKKHYKGFIFQFDFRHPLSIVRGYLENKGY